MLMLKLWIAAAPAVCDHPPQHHRDELPCESLCKEWRLAKYPTVVPAQWQDLELVDTAHGWRQMP